MYVRLGNVLLGPGNVSLPYGSGAYGGGAYGGGVNAGVSALYIADASTGGQALEVDDQINARTTCQFTVVDVLGFYTFPQGTQLQIFDDNNVCVFGGFVADALETKPGPSVPTLLHAVKGMDYHYLADKRVVATVFVAGQTVGACVQALVTGWLAGEGVTVGGIQTGPALSGTITYNYKTASYILDQLAQLANYSWYIDAYRRLWFFSGATFSAPWTFDGTQPGTYDGGSGGQVGVSIEHFNANYRNAQYVLGAKEVTAAQTETHHGDGIAKSFTLGYPVHQAPSALTVNGVGQTIGNKASGGTGSQWYWQKGDTTLYQDSGGTALISTDTLSVTYIGEYEVVAYAQDGGQITTEAALEGFGSGIVEDVLTDTKLTTASQAFQEAAGLLGEYSSTGTILTLRTTQYGLQASQMLTVNLPWGNKTVSGQFLVEKVILRYEPNNEVGTWWYEATCTQGPVSETWVQWFTRIVQPQASLIDVSSLGAAQQVIILASGTVAWTLTLTGYAQIITYSYPSSSQYPSSSTYPGTAGSQTAITWTKTNVGLNALRDSLFGTSDKVWYLAWGTGTQGTPGTATQLASEQGRKLVTSFAAGGVGEQIITTVLGPQDANGVAITELGLFAGPTAGAGANTGVMLLYGLYSHTKASSESVNVVADGTFS